MTANASIPLAESTLFARVEPTCDAVVNQYATNLHAWCDLVFYRDADTTQFYARRCACLRWRLRARPSRVTLNCFNWSVRWLPSMAAEVRNGDE